MNIKKLVDLSTHFYLEFIQDTHFSPHNQFGRDILSEDARGVWHAATDWFASQGATIREVHLPHAEHAFHCYSVVVEVDVASSMARLSLKIWLLFHPLTKKDIDANANSDTMAFAMDTAARRRWESPIWSTSPAVERRHSAEA